MIFDLLDAVFFSKNLPSLFSRQLIVNRIDTKSHNIDIEVLSLSPSHEDPLPLIRGKQVFDLRDLD